MASVLFYCVLISMSFLSAGIVLLFDLMTLTNFQKNKISSEKTKLYLLGAFLETAASYADVMKAAIDSINL